MTPRRAGRPEPLTIALDLDLTLIDTRRATAFALERVNVSCGEDVDVEVFVARLGLPLHDEFLRWMPAERVPAAVDVFRAGFLDGGLQYLVPMPGARQLEGRIKDSGGRLAVVTSRIDRIARASLRACGLTADVVIGGVSGHEKAPPLRQLGAAMYVGDHPLDMLAAALAGVPGVGVTTGAHTRKDLESAGADRIVDSLTELSPVLGGARGRPSLD